MIKANSFKAGRIYSVIYDSEVGMVQKRDGLDNPLLGALVTVRRVSSVQAAGNKTWANYKAKAGIVTTSTQTPWWSVSPENSCIVVGTSENTKGKEYLRGLPRGVTKETYMVNGIVATPAQVENIRAFKKNKSDSPAAFVMLSIDKLVNVDNETGDDE